MSSIGGWQHRRQQTLLRARSTQYCSFRCDFFWCLSEVKTTENMETLTFGFRHSNLKQLQSVSTRLVNFLLASKSLRFSYNRHIRKGQKEKLPLNFPKLNWRHQVWLFLHIEKDPSINGAMNLAVFVKVWFRNSRTPKQLQLFVSFLNRLYLCRLTDAAQINFLK